MSSVDIDHLLTPISDKLPAGEDLEYDPEFGELVLAAQRKPEQRMGDHFIPAVEPDWSDVFDKSTALFTRTKDYRVAVIFTNSAFQQNGFEGLADGLTVIRLLTEQLWEGVHPQLDAEDNNDSSFRVNALIALNDENGTLGMVRTAPMVVSKAMGKFSMRDYLIATGDLSLASAVVAEGEVSDEDGGNSGAPQLSHIDAAFMDVDIDELQLTQTAVQRAAEETSAISSLFVDLVGTMDAPDFDPVTQELWQVNNVLVDHLARRGVGEGVEVEADSAGGGAISGQISSRDDALLMMDRICDYFVRHEPSSPVPLLLRRAKRLVAADFLDILRDMTPDGVHQAESIGGVQSTDGYE